MDYPVALDGFEGHRITLSPQGWFTTPKLLIDGRPAPKGKKANQFVLRSDYGTEIVAQIRASVFGLDPVPQLVVDGKKIQVAEPLTWFQLLWSGIPLLLLVVGGALGGLCGAGAVALNIRVFRSQGGNMVKYLLTAFVSLTAAVVYLFLVIVATIIIDLVFRTG
jgi:hypothetical protein